MTGYKREEKCTRNGIMKVQSATKGGNKFQKDTRKGINTKARKKDKEENKS